MQVCFFDLSVQWEAEEQRRDILETQRQGIESARKSGKHLGRPPKMINYTNFKKEYDLWKSGKQTANLSKLTPSIFFKKLKKI